MSIDLRKKELRAHFRAIRSAIPAEEKRAHDEKIRAHFLSLQEYKRCKTLLCYVPLPGEIDTVPLLEDAWRSGRSVAVPYCVPGTRKLSFYLIHSLDALKEGAFGVLEPDPQKEEALADYEGALCLVPGYSWDPAGYRLGYGGGYYDRFLAGPFAGHPTVGACYGACLCEQMIRDEYDMACALVLTEDGVAGA